LRSGHKSTRGEAYHAIDGERDYQDNLPKSRSKSGTTIRPVAGYLVMIDHYIRHSQDAWTLKAGVVDILHDMWKIAALATRCMEEHGALPRAGYTSLYGEEPKDDAQSF
jgi:hypothetical protein